MLRLLRFAALLLAPLVLLASCGGGASSSYQGSILSGKVLMGANSPLVGASVCVYAIGGGQGNTPLNVVAGAVNPLFDSTGTVLISNTGYTYAFRGSFLTPSVPPSCGVTTASDGSFSIDLSSFYGPVLIQTSGGSFSSVAGGSPTLNNLTNTMSGLQAVAVLGGGGTVPVLVTPLSTIATYVALAPPLGSLSTRMDTSHYNNALAYVATQFGLSASDIDTTAPTSSTSAAAADLLSTPANQVLLGVQQYLASNAFCAASSCSGAADPNGTRLLEWATYVGADVSTYFGTLPTQYTYSASSPSSAQQAIAAALGDSSTAGTVWANFIAAYNTANASTSTTWSGPTSAAIYH